VTFNELLEVTTEMTIEAAHVRLQASVSNGHAKRFVSTPTLLYANEVQAHLDTEAFLDNRSR
jgi:hypothetical protein